MAGALGHAWGGRAAAYAAHPIAAHEIPRGAEVTHTRYDIGLASVYPSSGVGCSRPGYGQQGSARHVAGPPSPPRGRTDGTKLAQTHVRRHGPEVGLRRFVRHPEEACVLMLRQALPS